MLYNSIDVRPDPRPNVSCLPLFLPNSLCWLYMWTCDIWHPCQQYIASKHWHVLDVVPTAVNLSNGIPNGQVGSRRLDYCWLSWGTSVRMVILCEGSAAVSSKRDIQMSKFGIPSTPDMEFESKVINYYFSWIIKSFACATPTHTYMYMKCTGSMAFYSPT